MEDMMINREISVTISIPPDELGAKVANAGCGYQAMFLEALAEGFARFSSGDRDGAQMFFIKDKLPKDGKALPFLKKLVEYLEEEEER